MWLVLTALRRPITILVIVLSVALFAYLAVGNMPIDIFPKLGAPVVYVAQPFGGMDPAQVEGFLTYYFEYHFLYITGIQHVESKNIQGVGLIKLVFHPGTDMSQALAEVVGYVNRARAFMPPGVVPPFIVRYDAGSVPVGQLVFSSPTLSPGEMQDIALNRVRPLFATLPGVSAPPPFGGNQRTIVIRIDPERLRAYRISPVEVIAAVNRGSTVLPSGNVRTGDFLRISSTNSVLGGNLQELDMMPIRTGSGPAVYLRDIGVVENGTDVVTGYAHVNGRRTVYIPVTKRADASTLAVIHEIKQALPAMRAVAKAVSPDVDIRLEFDQSPLVTNSIRNLVKEGLLGACLTGLMVLIFLRDLRSVMIVVLTIPFSLLAAVVALWGSGQTINLMTLGGLALAVGVLVDESTVVIESMHTHLASGLSGARSVVEASRKTAVPRLLAMLCVLSVFIPSFFMVGAGRQMFVPLSLAVGFAMLSSYFLSSTFVPVLGTWVLRRGHEEDPERTFFGRFRAGYGKFLGATLRLRWPAVGLYLAGAALLFYFLVPRLGTEIFPTVDTGQFQLRLRAPTGTRIERTELVALKTVDIIRQEVGPENVQITSGFIGVQPPSYPVNTIFLWTSGPHEAVLQVALKRTAHINVEELKERLRHKLPDALPGTTFSFEAGDIISQVMSFGSPTPIEVAVAGPNLTAVRPFAEKVRQELAKIPALRDLQYGQPLDYPTLEVQVDRERAGQLGVTSADVARSLVVATSSSRFTDPNFWRDPNSGFAFQIQVEIPQHKIASMDDVQNLPVMLNGNPRPLVGDVASIRYGTMMGEVDRYNMQRMLTLTANIHGQVLGPVTEQIREAIGRAGAPPQAVRVAVRGQVQPLEDTMSGLRTGLLLSILVIFLLLAANFQSFRMAFAVISTVPAVICGVAIMLALTGTTLNIQSFMGAIMAVGVAVANAILLVTFAQAAHQEGASNIEAALEGARGRLRAILMTATAMMAGMIPMALGLGEGGEQGAPLGRAVIGGLAAATIATLAILPSVYAIIQRRAHAGSASLDPDDPASRHYEGN